MTTIQGPILEINLFIFKTNSMSKSQIGAVIIYLWKNKLVKLKDNINGTLITEDSDFNISNRHKNREQNSYKNK